MEITQFTYFQQCGGFELSPIPVELTYGLERIAMYLQKVDHFKDLEWVKGYSYGDVYMRNENEQADYGFKESNSSLLFSQFASTEKESLSLAEKGLALPAYEQCIKASHIFNLLDARGVISVSQRAQYIRRVREMALSSAKAWKDGEEQGVDS
jgi:glycyl-tRNA synthetase alpha chain